MPLVLYPYLLGSRSAKELATALSTKQVRPDGRYRPRPNHVVINWGNSRPPTAWRPERWLNAPQCVALAANKLAAFRRMQEAGVPIPAFTDLASVAKAWDKTIVIRHKLSGHSGAGIEFGEAGILPPPAPLYTAYGGKRDEYRVHVFQGAIIDRQVKLRRRGISEDQINWRIRNHATGWIYARGLAMPGDIDSPAINAIAALGLDFGAVDIIRTKGRHDQVQVLEINTAPGLQGTTLGAYHRAFTTFARQTQGIPEGASVGVATIHRHISRRTMARGSIRRPQAGG